MKRPIMKFGLYACGTALLCGLVAWFLHASSAPPVARIVLNAKASIKMPSLDTPDLFLVVFDDQDRKWTSATQNNAVLGDGLPILLPRPPAAQDSQAFSARNVTRVEVWDAGIITDGLLDRFALKGGVGSGELYRATAEYREDGASTFTRVLLISGAVIGVVGLILVVRGSAITALTLHES